VVDDDTTVSSVVVSYLLRGGHEAVAVDDGFAALEAIASGQPDLVVLDLMLPGLDGFEVCRRARADFPVLPIIMLTALGEPDDRIAGLELGADDYVAKPFSPRELILRIESVLRRSVTTRAATPNALAIGAVKVDVAGRRALLRGSELVLTLRELDLLIYLMSNPGEAFSREHLMREVWGWSYGDQSTVTVHVRRLRMKIEDDPSRPTLIQTVWGVGYRLDPGP